MPQAILVPVDGDSSAGDRELGRTRAHFLLSNPDLLHHTMLRHHDEWRRIFRNLRYIDLFLLHPQCRFCVLDEAHMYHGAFGSHVSLIMRRLQRLCLFYGNNNVQFICCSATLAQPEQFFDKLVPRF